MLACLTEIMVECEFKMSSVEAPDELVDKNGFSIKKKRETPISDKECILICLEK